MFEAYLEWFGLETARGYWKEQNRPDKRQYQNGKLRAEYRFVERQLNEALIHEILYQLKKKLKKGY